MGRAEQAVLPLADLVAEAMRLQWPATEVGVALMAFCSRPPGVVQRLARALGVRLQKMHVTVALDD
eukprot:8927074-Lingulodinium_polyedra.AAC.1